MPIPKVSIIITFYNLGDYVEEAINSCLVQTYRNYEIILVNDGTDEKNSKLKLKLLKKRLAGRVKFFYQKNRGVSAARNSGIKAATGEYICCLDADDQLDRQYLTRIMRVFVKKPSLGFVCSWIRVFGKRTEIIKTPPYNLARLLVTNCIPVPSVFPKALWEKVGGYTTSIASKKLIALEDWDFWIKIASLDYRWGVVPQPLFFYRVRAGSMIMRERIHQERLIKMVVENNLAAYQGNIPKIMAEFYRYHAIFINTRGWKILDHWRSLRNRVGDFLR